MSEKPNFILARVNWSYIPPLVELETFMAVSSGYTVPPKKMPSLSALSKKGYKPAFMYGPKDYVMHNTGDETKVRRLYEQNGFKTAFLMQDPFGHPGPTVACPIGFPFNLPEPFEELKRFNRWICRIHVDITQHPNGRLVSVPHIEPDPAFHKLAHLWDTFIKGNVVRGEAAVKVLHFLGI